MAEIIPKLATSLVLYALFVFLQPVRLNPGAGLQFQVSADRISSTAPSVEVTILGEPIQVHPFGCKPCLGRVVTTLLLLLLLLLLLETRRSTWDV